jgi:hypothetical protein
MSGGTSLGELDWLHVIANPRFPVQDPVSR